MKMIVLYGLLLIGKCFILHNFTLVNLSVKLLFLSSQNFPELEDGLENEEIILTRVGKKFKDSKDPEFTYVPVFNSIRYFPENNFYLISDYTTSQFYKIDSLGNTREVFGIQKTSSDQFSLIDAQGLAFTVKHVYDINNNHSVGQRFEKVLNENLELSAEEWNNTFKKFYEQSNTVIYNSSEENGSRNAIIYFHKENKWIKLYGSNGNTILRKDSNGSHVRIGEEKLYAKYALVYQSFYLKDPTHEVFSNANRTNNKDFHMDRYYLPNRDIEETELEYTKVGEVRLKGFKKIEYTADGYYNPGIPTTFYGVAYYQLKIREKLLDFKNNATRSIFSKVRSDLYLFGPPKEFEHKNAVRFMAYDYHVNLRDNGKKGIYVIRMK